MAYESLSEEYAYAGIDPNAPNDRGYECRKCGHVPTNRELDNGTCTGCREIRLAALANPPQV